MESADLTVKEERRTYIINLVLGIAYGQYNLGILFLPMGFIARAFSNIL